MRESPKQPFPLSFNRFLRVAFPGSRGSTAAPVANLRWKGSVGGKWVYTRTCPRPPKLISGESSGTNNSGRRNSKRNSRLGGLE